MEYKINSIRPFIGAKDYKLSCQFYVDLGFEEIKTGFKMSFFHIGNFGFYLQDAYVKDWVDNSMIFMEVDDLQLHLKLIRDKNLERNYPDLRLSEIHFNDWGNEFFKYDPSGILWHIGEFRKK
ncbi:glyoxalase [Gramella sp. BOM4]|nr:glyoxalase [Christiangramia bathymodioli]